MNHEEFTVNALDMTTQVLELLSKNIKEINKILENLNKRLKELERYELYTEDAAARILGVSTDEIVRLREEGKLAFQKFHAYGEWKTTIAAIEEYLNVHGEQE